MKIYKNYSLVVLRLPLFHCGISAGFPSPADDHLEDRIDLNHEFIKNKDATFFGRAEGDSMEGAGISNGDLLVIDKSLKPKSGQIAVCFLDGEFTVKRIQIEKNVIWLIAENKKYAPIKVTADNEFVIWGIVTNVIKYL
ncbi:LexA family protein [Zunongwangia profunda]|mgnify:FL=1|uniref:LexA family protein n=1 Tax=Zunongwangia profunda TaxID=398743 RepID=UPI002353168E|tara:strand:- start:5264 stop:5680 length:417 start_codon:yes stop_codon:yes gene_type:complete